MTPWAAGAARPAGPGEAALPTGADRGALAGVLVADFSRVLSGPYATMLLADLGATVVKVERPEIGDDTRAWGPPFVDGESAYYLSVNRNKHSLVLDLADHGDRLLARRLAERADVLVENFRPGLMQRFGLGYDDVRGANPGLVYCSVSGFGAGPGRDLPGYDFVVQAVGGLMSITGAGPDDPTKVGVAVVDVLAGLHAAIAVLAALRHRDRTGAGQLVQTNLLSSLLASLVNQASTYVTTGQVPRALGNRHPSIAPYETVAAADGALALAVGNDKQFAALCAVLDLPEAAADDRFASNAGRVRNRGALVAALQGRLATGSVADWVSRLTAAGVPCGAVNDLAGAFALAGRLGLDPVVDVDGVRQTASPMALSVTPVTYRCRPPHLGSAADVRRWLATDPPTEHPWR